MFDVSFSELILIGIVALVVIGPERLPRVARTVGLLLGRMQRYVNDVKADISREIQLDELKKLKADVQESARNFERDMTNGLREFQQDVEQAAGSFAEEARLAAPSPAEEAPHAEAPENSRE